MMDFLTSKMIRLIGVCFVVGLLLLNTAPVSATGPFPPLARSFYARYPDLPLQVFAAGRLGVLRPTFARSYLAVAYRYLDGKPLSSQERKSALQLWNYRLGLSGNSKGSSDAGQSVEKASTVWLAARRRVPSVPIIKSINVYGTYNHGIISNYLACSSDAFLNATKTLNTLIKTFGLRSKSVNEWVVAQDAVFANLSADQHHSADPKAVNIPPPLSSREKSALLKAARNYQIAAANFYAQNYDKAEVLFAEIAKDRRSPWRGIAPYLAARAVIRKSSLQLSDNDVKVLRRAESLLRKQLVGENNTQLRKASLTLLRLVRCRQQRIGELSDFVSNPSGSQFGQHLDDYTLTLDAMLSYAGQSELKWRDIPVGIRRREMTDWMLAFQCSDTPAYLHCLERWRKSRSVAWLLASLSKAEPKDADVRKLIDAVTEVEVDSPAYVSVSYHLIRLQSQMGKLSQARKRLQSITSKTEAMSISTANEFKELAVRMDGSLPELVAHCVIKPATVSTGESDLPLLGGHGKSIEPPLIFDRKTVDTLNQYLPLKLFKQIALSKALSAALRRETLGSIWVRAALLGDNSVAQSVSKQLMKESPSFSPYVNSWLSSKTPDEKKFLAAYFILKFPGLRPYLTGGLPRATPVNKIDTYQENWWKNANGDPSFYEDYGDPDLQRARDKPLRGDLPVLRIPAFLTIEERKQLAVEMKSLAASSPAPNYLSAQIIKWSKAHPADSRVPEALHLAVVSTRYGSTNDGTSKYSNQAFQILHKQYPKSEWTKKTPYSF